MMDSRQAMQAYLEQRFNNFELVTPFDVNELLISFIGEGINDFVAKRLAAGATVDEVNIELKQVVESFEIWRKETLGRWVRRMNEPFAPSQEIH